MESRIAFILIVSLGLLLFGCTSQPVAPAVCNNTCASGEAQALYPDCSCAVPIAPSCTNTCPADNTRADYPNCTCIAPAPPVQVMVDCGTNETCFYSNLASCSKASFEVIQGEEPQIVDAKYTINGSKDGGCLVEMTMIQFPMPSFVGTVMDCIVPQDATTPDAYQSQFGPVAGTKLLTDCSGTYIDTMKAAYGIQ